MTRAVIKLKKDISKVMPVMARRIEGCAYNEVTPVASFIYKNYGVIVNRRQITINNAGDEVAAREVMNFLNNIVSAGKIAGKEGND